MKNKPKKRGLFLDNRRTPETNELINWAIVRSYQEFKDYLMIQPRLPEIISFDHDLTEEHENDYADQLARIGWHSPSYDLYKTETGLECARFLCEMVFGVIEKDESSFPICAVHSANPVGADNIQKYINAFKKHKGWTQDCFIHTVKTNQ